MEKDFFRIIKKSFLWEEESIMVKSIIDREVFPYFHFMIMVHGFHVRDKNKCKESKV